MPYLKITSRMEYHDDRTREYSYKTGLNVLESGLESNELAFTDKKNIHHFFPHGAYLRVVKLPSIESYPSFQMIEHPLVSEPNPIPRWRANAIVLGERMGLWEARTFLFLYELGVSPRAGGCYLFNKVSPSTKNEIIDLLMERDDLVNEDTYLLAQALNTYPNLEKLINYLIFSDRNLVVKRMFELGPKSRYHEFLKRLIKCDLTIRYEWIIEFLLEQMIDLRTMPLLIKWIYRNGEYHRIADWIGKNYTIESNISNVIEPANSYSLRHRLFTSSCMVGKIDLIRGFIGETYQFDFKTCIRGLELASRNGHSEVFRILEDHLKNTPFKNKSYSNPPSHLITWAARNGHFEMVKHLKERGCDPCHNHSYAFRYAAKNNHLEIVSYLLDCGCDINATNSWALRHVAGSYRIKMVEFLLERGAQITVGNKSAYEYAMKRNNLEVARIIKDWEEK